MLASQKAIIRLTEAGGRVCLCQISDVFESEGNNYAELDGVYEDTEEMVALLKRVVRGGDPIFQDVEESQLAAGLRGCLKARIERRINPAPGPASSLIVGVWAVRGGDPRETTEFRADGTVQMRVAGGMFAMNGFYHFVNSDLVEINWYQQASPEADAVVAAINQELARQPQSPNVRIVSQTVWWVSITETEMTTLLLEKGRVGRYHRVQHS